MNASTINPEEVAKFEAMAAEWWNPDGKFKPLHKFNPTRLDYIITHICTQFNRLRSAPDSLKGVNILDIGCGGGLLCEPLTRLGATVTGIDVTEANIKVARLHAEQEGLDIDYKIISSEELVKTKTTFDVVLNMEVVEHVGDVDLFMKSCGQLVKPGGLMFYATLNRTAKSYLLAILGAEYILRWLPTGTHDWHKFLSPQELTDYLTLNGMHNLDTAGMSFMPLTGKWHLSKDLGVNYIGLAQKQYD